jgi:hypothetical protein
MQFQTTRCDENDVLAGHDDPNLPLVTYSTDGQEVFLHESILGGENVEHASAGWDRQFDWYLVELQFDKFKRPSHTVAPRSPLTSPRIPRGIWPVHLTASYRRRLCRLRRQQTKCSRRQHFPWCFGLR